MSYTNSNPNQLPTLNTFKLDPLTPFNRLHLLLYSFSLLLLFYHHLTSSSPLLLTLSDLILAFQWAFTQAFRWRPIRRREFPDRIPEDNLPSLDVFICTADPWKEPPMTVVNTALSVMAYEYPSDKISVYVSDDGGSDLTLFAFMEAAKFARSWLPFCTENRIVKRAPEAYFASSTVNGSGSEEIEMMYEKMKEKVEGAMEKGYVSSGHLDINAEEYDVLKKWKSYTRRDHPAVVQVLLESSKDSDIMGNAMPSLIYVSREKRPTCAHHFKAGALNALTRVSSIMSNAPVILTLDCDMSSYDPQTPRRALCYILDPAIAPKLAYVQFPQRFQGLNKNDIYGSEIKRLYRINLRGFDGLLGPNYIGSGCFFVRRALYGPQSPGPGPFPSDLKEYLMSDANRGSMRSESVLKRAHEVAGCNYELDTKWGSEIGFRYGSLVEDLNTGYRMQCEGWVSIFCDPERPAFLGDAPKNLNDALSQNKRWVVGQLEFIVSKYSPLTFGIRKASLLMGMAYAWFFWGFLSIPLTIYALLPQLALIYNVQLFPKLSDPWFYLYAYLFFTAYSQDLIEFLMDNGTIQTWWSDQRMWMIRGLTSFASGTIQFIINQTGISAPAFTLTNKATEEGQSERYDNGVFEFGVSSPFFVSLGTAAILNLSSFMFGMLTATRREGFFCEMFVPLFLSAFGVANCWPILEAMFLREDGGKMPRNVTAVSILVAGLICISGYFALVD